VRERERARKRERERERERESERETERESEREGAIEENDYFLFSLPNVIGIVTMTRLMTDASRFLFRQGQKTFFSLQSA